MKIIAQMDDLSSINIKTDSTFAILLEAQNRGHEIYYYLPENLVLSGKKVSALTHKVQLKNQAGDYYQILKSENTDLATADIILFRQDPPFDIKYITSSYILEKIQDQVLIINNPVEIRNCPEKIFVTDFPEFCPPTIITSNLEEVKNFKEQYRDIIIKPLYTGGGEGILHLRENDRNLGVVFKMMKEIYQSPIIAQKFLEEVKNGDKRVLMLDGEPVGAVNRIAKKDEIRSNFHAGGLPAKTELTTKEQEICRIVGKELKKKGLIFVGLDFIGEYLTEINVTSPTGIREINQLNNSCIEKLVVDCLEKKFKEFKA